MLYAIFAVAALGALGLAYEIPPNLKSIYDAHKAGSCSNALSDPMNNDVVYCGDIPNAIFLKGKDEYDDMGIDCDGLNNDTGDCAVEPSAGQPDTAFMDTVAEFGIPNLDPNVHSIVVFGNAEGPPPFVPQDKGMVPLSVMAVVCNNQLFYGIWGDVMGSNLTGQASLSLAKMCFPDEGLNSNNGHDANDVLYIGFPGEEAAPGKDGANWRASSTIEFMDSIKALGDRLVARLDVSRHSRG